MIQKSPPQINKQMNACCWSFAWIFQATNIYLFIPPQANFNKVKS